MENAKAKVSNLIHGHNKDDNAQEHTHDTSSATKDTSSTSKPNATLNQNDTNNNNDPKESPATTQGSRTLEGGAHDGATHSADKGKSDLGADLEKELSGPRDPAVKGEEHPKMTGDGAPGSHSAVFGLTPDGKAENAPGGGS